MKIFFKDKDFEANCEKMAHRILENMFTEDDRRWGPYSSTSPAGRIAETLLREKLKEQDILEKMDVVLVETAVEKHLAKVMKDLLTESFIEDIVQKINKVQLKRNRE